MITIIRWFFSYDFSSFFVLDHEAIVTERIVSSAVISMGNYLEGSCAFCGERETHALHPWFQSGELKKAHPHDFTLQWNYEFGFTLCRNSKDRIWTSLSLFLHVRPLPQWVQKLCDGFLQCFNCATGYPTQTWKNWREGWFFPLWLPRTL